MKRNSLFNERSLSLLLLSLVFSLMLIHSAPSALAVDVNLTYTSDLADVSPTDANQDNCFMMKWDITSIPSGSTFHNAYLWIYHYIDQAGTCNYVMNISYCADQTWDESLSAADYNAMEFVYKQQYTYSSAEDVYQKWNVTDVVSTCFANGEDNCTIKVEGNELVYTECLVETASAIQDDAGLMDACRQYDYSRWEDRENSLGTGFRPMLELIYDPPTPNIKDLSTNRTWVSMLFGALFDVNVSAVSDTTLKVWIEDNSTGHWANHSTNCPTVRTITATANTWYNPNFTWTARDYSEDKAFQYRAWVNDTATGITNHTDMKTAYIMPYITDHEEEATCEITKAWATVGYNTWFGYVGSGSCWVEANVSPFYVDGKTACRYKSALADRLWQQNLTESCLVRLNMTLPLGPVAFSMEEAPEITTVAPPNLPAALVAAMTGIIIFITVITTKRKTEEWA